MIKSREIRLKYRPQGLPDLDCFELASVELPDINDGELLIKNLWMSVDPYMRGRMDGAESYVDPFEIGKPMDGGAIGQVVASRSVDFSVGDYVLHEYGWREHFVFSTTDTEDELLGGLQKVDKTVAPIEAYLGVAGMPGMTAYAGLTTVAHLKPGETVFVSAAAGAVGSVACQIARIRGCKVVASAGSSQKVEWLKNKAGVDAAFNYKTVSSIHDAVADACPDGIDVYFENVGGEHLSAAISHMNTGGRIALCGLISQYNIPTETDEHELFSRILHNSLTVRGFIVTEFWDQYPEFLTQISKWISDGRIVWEETVFDGIESAPQAFLGLFAGRNLGKMLVKLAEDS